MSPASNLHGYEQGEIYSELKRKRGGKVIIECSTQTTHGVRAADVSWQYVSNRARRTNIKATP
jgi:hypothetical protein